MFCLAFAVTNTYAELMPCVGDMCRPANLGKADVLIPEDGRLELKRFGVRLHIPEVWRDKVWLKDLNMGDDKDILAGYGFFLVPQVKPTQNLLDALANQTQYLGSLVVYERSFWRESVAQNKVKQVQTDDGVYAYWGQSPFQFIVLKETGDYVFVYFGGFSNLSVDLEPDGLYRKLAIPITEIASLLIIEEL